MSERTRPTHCYIGKCEGCGAIEASRYDDRDKHTGQAVADMIACGLLVERVPFGSYSVSDCVCPKPPQTVQEAMQL